MSTPSELRASEIKAISDLAKTLHSVIPKGTTDATMFSGALAFICTLAEVSPHRTAIAQLMHAAADELLKGGAGFGAVTH